MLDMMIAYKAWAEGIAYDAALAIPLEEVLRERPITFGNIVMTLNHILVVDDIFRHHLEGRPHGYATRNTPETPGLAELRERAAAMTAWYADQVAAWSPRDRAGLIEFTFVGGGRGAMTREQIVLHVVNHSTYHRGFVGDMLKQIPYHWPANDLTVFLRDIWQAPVADTEPPTISSAVS
jgi:uncharacterized damage-inducible protein DinB